LGEVVLSDKTAHLLHRLQTAHAKLSPPIHIFHEYKNIPFENPPLERKTIGIGKSEIADEEMVLAYTKGCTSLWDMESYSHILLEEQRQNLKQRLLSSPNDPFALHASHLMNVDLRRVTFYLRVTNLTEFPVKKLRMCVKTRGGLCAFSKGTFHLFTPLASHSLLDTRSMKSIPQLGPTKSYEWKEVYEVKFFSSNSIDVEVILENDRNRKAEDAERIHKREICIHANAPYHLNINELIFPCRLTTTEFLKQWNR